MFISTNLTWSTFQTIDGLSAKHHSHFVDTLRKNLSWRSEIRERHSNWICHSSVKKYSLALPSRLTVVFHSLAQVLGLLLQIRAKVLMDKKQLSEIAQKRTKQTKGSESWWRDGDLLDNIFSALSATAPYLAFETMEKIIGIPRQASQSDKLV